MTEKEAQQTAEDWKRYAAEIEKIHRWYEQHGYEKPYPGERAAE